MSQILSKSSQKKALRYGIPFLVCIIGGSFGLREFAQIRYSFSKNSQIKPEELEAAGIEVQEVTLENEYEKIKSIDIENWEPIRGPRPWEEETIPEKVKEKLNNKS